MNNLHLDKYISLSEIKKEENLDTSSFLLLKKHNEDFIRKKLDEYQEYFDKLYQGIDNNIILDYEQRLAILNDEDYAMIIAGAGSGKTTTMAGKVKYLVDKLHINPSEILVLSYTNKAVDELRDRINKHFNLPACVSTFHKLAYSYLKNNKYKILTTTLPIIDQYIVNSIIHNKEEASTILKFYRQYFEISPLLLHLLQKKYYQKVISRYQSNKTLRGDYLYHKGEVMLADLLYLNNINYIYQKAGWYTAFLLDINNQKYYLRVLKNSSVLCKPPFIYSNHLHIINLIIPSVNESNFMNIVKELQRNKIINRSITLDDYYQYNIKLDKQKYERFSYFCYNFIKGMKNANKKEIIIKDKNFDERTKLFVSFINNLYQYYQNYLNQNKYLDFDDLIIEADKNISNQNINYKYIIVDEYQDISPVRFQFIKHLVNYYHSKLVVVGDDWQTIFSFAGSNINLFLDFKRQMGYAEELKITNTYRNSQELIDMAGQFIMRNAKQIKKQLHSPKHLLRPITVFMYQNNMIQSLCWIIESLIETYGTDKNILLLGRYHFDINNIIDNKNFMKQDNQKITYTKNNKISIKFMTIHMAKGLGFDNVILLNGSDGIYGFPSLIEDDPLFRIIDGNQEGESLEEERRLFYVALTRTKNKFYILSPTRNMSPFVKELREYPQIEFKKVTNVRKSEKKRKKY